MQEEATHAERQHQQAAEQHAAATAANMDHMQHLSSEVQQQQAQLDRVQQQLQTAHQQRDAAQGQLDAWQAQHAQQAPQISELLTERQAWIQELQRERAAASAAAATAEVRGVLWFTWLSSGAYNDTWQQVSGTEVCCDFAWRQGLDRVQQDSCLANSLWFGVLRQLYQHRVWHLAKVSLSLSPHFGELLVVAQNIDSVVSQMRKTLYTKISTT